jgi:DNA excision repair protein ERCC-6-like 2
VLFDPNWNPAHDLQAQDRAFRIGQRRDVEVYRLISQGTVEEIVYARQIYKQQQANIGYDASTERRYFKGVQGDRHGELFGLENIFSFDPDRPFLRHVVQKTSIAEQSIAMAELNFSQQERESALQLDSVDGISGVRQFAKISSQNEPEDEEEHVDPVTAILSEVGVEYTHLNMEIIGSSRVEARISEMAISAAKDSERGDLRAYLSTHGVGGNQYKIGNVPLDVRTRQFRSMAALFGQKSVSAFGLLVENIKSEERTQLLGVFYRERRALLERLGLDHEDEGL